MSIFDVAKIVLLLIKQVIVQKNRAYRVICYLVKNKLKHTDMTYALLAIVIGLAAILLAKFVMPKMQAKMEEQARIQKEKKDAKKAEKEK